MELNDRHPSNEWRRTLPESVPERYGASSFLLWLFSLARMQRNRKSARPFVLLVCTMDDDAATLHRAVDEIRVAHAAALAALAAFELSMPPLPPRPPIRFGRLGDAVMGDVTTLQPYFVHGAADSLSPLFFTSGSLEHAFLTSHRGDSQDCLDDDTATPKELVLRKRAGCLHNVDGVYAALLYLARAPSGTSRCY